MRMHVQEDDRLVVSFPPAATQLSFQRVCKGGQMPPDEEAEGLTPAAGEDAAPVAATSAKDGGGDTAASGSGGTTTTGAAAGSNDAAAAGQGPSTGGEQAGPARPANIKGGQAMPMLPPRQAKFDPIKTMSALHAAGADISKDGSDANRDEYSLPTRVT